MKKRNSLIALILVFALALVGCGQKSNAPANNKAENNKAEETSEAKSDIVVGFVTDEGGINDQSFNQGVWEGVEKAKEDFGIASKFKESKDSNEYMPNFETLLDEGANLIVGAGFKMGDVVIETAKNNPDVKFAIVDVDPTVGYDKEGNMVEVEAPANLLGIMFKAQEPSFLVGYIAGHTTESNVVGFVGGQESVLIGAFEYGFTAGVKYAANELGKEIEVKSQYAGNFTDAQKGKAIANQMFEQGADVIFHAAGGVGDGVIKSAEEHGKWAIGVDRDQLEVAPNNVLTSAMKNANVAVYNVIKELVEEGKFEGGRTIELGLKDAGAVGIAPTSDKHVAKEVLDKVEEIKNKIVAEEIVVPHDAETYDAFVKAL